ncbi:MAG: PorV/PorQ family protein, partial [Elusimicrobiales bacterium]|nr:PorV/PorQ family protein [Elusimicrobiales bacterium]
MKTKKMIAPACLAAALLAGPGPFASAADNTGTSAAQFLKIGPSARMAALADSGSALTDDIYAAYYNPAGLALVGKPTMAASHTQYVQGAGYQFGSAALPLESGGVLAFSVANLGVEDLERRTQDTDLPVGYFDSSNFAYTLSYGRQLTDRLAAGASLKQVSVTIDEVSGSATALDAGLRHEPALILDFPVYWSLAVRNFGTRMKMGQGRDPLPSAIVLGGMARPRPDLALTLDLLRYRDAGVIVAAGGEYTRPITGSMNGVLRAGYSNHRRDIDGNAKITLGAGLALPGLAFDFAWVP